MKLRLAALAFTFSALAFAQDTTLGKPLTLAQSATLIQLFAKADSLVGQTVQVTAKVTEVCEMMGCWMDLTDNEGHLLRIKVDDGDIVFPKDSVGKTAIVEHCCPRQRGMVVGGIENKGLMREESEHGR